MLLNNRVLWGAIASTANSDLSLQTIIENAADIQLQGQPSARIPRNVAALECILTTSVQYTRAVELLNACASSSKRGTYAFEFLCAALKTPTRRYYCFFVPFRRMLGGVLRRINTSLRGKGCLWHRLEIMPTVELLRKSPDKVSNPAPLTSKLCGLDLHLLAGRGEQEIVFVGMNPAKSRVFAAVTDESEDFTLSPISATFCVGSTARRQNIASYFTIDRSGVINVAVGKSLRFLRHMMEMLVDFERSGTLHKSVDRPVYRSRNAHKRAILASISA
ncbi:MAG: hypothetical protein ACYS8Z_00395 [Planctomycetota bacterium]